MFVDMIYCSMTRVRWLMAIALHFTHSSCTLTLLLPTLNNNNNKNTKQQQYRPLIWRNTHPYVLVDRHEDVTNPNDVEQNPDCDRSIVYYGYVRGTHLKPSMKVHLIGVGDFGLTSVTAMPDPLPLPDKESERKVRKACAFAVLLCISQVDLRLLTVLCLFLFRSS
jgi:AARP2CN (NUC121) domain